MSVFRAKKQIEKVDGDFFMINGMKFDFVPLSTGGIDFRFEYKSDDGKENMKHLVVLPTVGGHLRVSHDMRV